MPPSVYRCYPRSSAAVWIGYALLAAGIILLFICIPGWAWLALIGIALIAAGWLILGMSTTWR